MTQTDSPAQSGRRTLLLEAEALTALAESLDGAFSHAIETLFSISGRVIVTGMGKSGHVARKIAATLASTGTLSFFVHPAEASHGDLGMVAPEDAVIALSNSGETSELSDILAFTRRFGIPLIAMTSRPDSTLAQQSDIPLILPPMAEACPHGLAPTTSTTMMLALGDALAVALLERRGFTAADFRLYHPGGKLGQRLLRVADLMHGGEAIPLIHPDSPMSEALMVMTSKHFGCVGVCGAEGRLIGIITDGDLRRHMSDSLLGKRVEAVMTHAPQTILATALAAEALHIMNSRKVTSLFVVDEAGVAVGVVHIHDLLRAGVA